MIRTHLDMMPDFDQNQRQQQQQQHRQSDQPQILPDSSPCPKQIQQAAVTFNNINQLSHQNLAQQKAACDSNSEETKFLRELEDLYVKESRWHAKLSWSYQPYRRAASLYSTASDESSQSDQTHSDKEEEEEENTTNGHFNKNDNHKPSKNTIKGYNNKHQQVVTSDSCISLNCDHVINGMPQHKQQQQQQSNYTNLTSCETVNGPTHYPITDQSQFISITIGGAYSSSGRGNSESAEFIKWPYQSSSNAQSMSRNGLNENRAIRRDYASIYSQRNIDQQTLSDAVSNQEAATTSSANVSTWQRLADKIYPLITTGSGSGILCGPGMQISSDQHEKIPLMKGDDEINMCNPILAAANKDLNAMKNQPNIDNYESGIRVSAKNVTSYGSGAPTKTNTTIHHKPDCSILIDQASHCTNKHEQLPLNNRFSDMEEHKRFKRSLAILFVLAIILIIGLTSFIIR